MNKLVLYYDKIEPTYIAVSKHGYGIDSKPAMAIWNAQEHVPANDKPSQMLLYRHHEAVKPVGFKNGGPVWPNGSKPRLVGLTTTHQGWRQRPR